MVQDNDAALASARKAAVLRRLARALSEDAESIRSLQFALPPAAPPHVTPQTLTLGPAMARAVEALLAANEDAAHRVAAQAAAVDELADAHEAAWETLL